MRQSIVNNCRSSFEPHYHKCSDFALSASLSPSLCCIIVDLVCPLNIYLCELSQRSYRSGNTPARCDSSINLFACLAYCSSHPQSMTLLLARDKWLWLHFVYVCVCVACVNCPHSRSTAHVPQRRPTPSLPINPSSRPVNKFNCCCCLLTHTHTHTRRSGLITISTYSTYLLYSPAHTLTHACLLDPALRP